MKKQILLLIFIFSGNSVLLSQVNSLQLISNLREALFTQDTSTMLLYEYIGKTKYPYQVDSMTRIRKEQPDPYSILPVLEKIMHSKDTSIFQDLNSIYNIHIKYFWEEWAKVYMDNYYAPKMVIMQYSILSGFETLLKSLNLTREQYSTLEIFENYKNALSFGMKIWFDLDDGCELMKEYQDSSPLYRKLHPCRIFGGSITFSYLDPYMNELKPHFLENLIDCQFEECSLRERSLSFTIFTQNRKFYHSELGSEVAQYFISNFDRIPECNRYSLIFQFARVRYHVPLSKFLAHKLVYEMSEQELSSYPYLRDYINNQHEMNLGHLIDELIELYQIDRVKSLMFFSQLPRDRTADLLESKKIVIENIIGELPGN